MSDKIKGVLVIFGLLLLLGVVGRMDADEAERQAEEYCYNVKSGIWPDYAGTYEQYCRASQK